MVESFSLPSPPPRLGPSAGGRDGKNTAPKRGDGLGGFGPGGALGLGPALSDHPVGPAEPQAHERVLFQERIFHLISPIFIGDDIDKFGLKEFLFFISQRCFESVIWIFRKYNNFQFMFYL